jgi:Ulp1 family protease
MNTHFFQKVLQPGRTAERGRRWLHKSGVHDVSLLELLLIPVGYFKHWALMVIDFAKHEIKWIDSCVAYTDLCCPETPREAIICVGKFLEEIFMIGAGVKTRYMVSDWYRVSVSCPQQERNSTECALFVIGNMEAIMGVQPLVAYNGTQALLRRRELEREIMES